MRHWILLHSRFGSLSLHLCLFLRTCTVGGFSLHGLVCVLSFFLHWSPLFSTAWVSTFLGPSHGATAQIFSCWIHWVIALHSGFSSLSLSSSLLLLRFLQFWDGVPSVCIFFSRFTHLSLRSFFPSFRISTHVPGDFWMLTLFSVRSSISRSHLTCTSLFTHCTLGLTALPPLRPLGCAGGALTTLCVCFHLSRTSARISLSLFSSGITALCISLFWITLLQSLFYSHVLSAVCLPLMGFRCSADLHLDHVLVLSHVFHAPLDGSHSPRSRIICTSLHSFRCAVALRTLPHSPHRAGFYRTSCTSHMGSRAYRASPLRAGSLERSPTHIGFLYIMHLSPLPTSGLRITSFSFFLHVSALFSAPLFSGCSFSFRSSAHGRSLLFPLDSWITRFLVHSRTCFLSGCHTSTSFTAPLSFTLHCIFPHSFLFSSNFLHIFCIVLHRFLMLSCTRSRAPGISFSRRFGLLSFAPVFHVHCVSQVHTLCFRSLSLPLSPVLLTGPALCLYGPPLVLPLSFSVTLCFPARITVTLTSRTSYLWFTLFTLSLFTLHTVLSCHWITPPGFTAHISLPGHSRILPARAHLFSSRFSPRSRPRSASCTVPRSDFRSAATRIALAFPHSRSLFSHRITSDHGFSRWIFALRSSNI